MSFLAKSYAPEYKLPPLERHASYADAPIQTRDELLYWLAPGASPELMEAFTKLPIELVSRLYPEMVKWRSVNGEEISRLIKFWASNFGSLSIPTVSNRTRRQLLTALVHASASVDETPAHELTLTQRLRPSLRKNTQGRRAAAVLDLNDQASTSLDELAGGYLPGLDHWLRQQNLKSHAACHLTALFVKDRIGAEGSIFTEKDFHVLTSQLPTA